MIVYEEGRFTDALREAQCLRGEGMRVELIPAATGKASPEAYRERGKASLQKEIRYLRADGTDCSDTWQEAERKEGNG